MLFYLSTMFWADFWHAQPVYLPALLNGYQSQAITHPLISEVLFNPAGQDETGHEWVELYNPSASTMSLAGYKLGDATDDGHVDIDDLLAVINAWGVCPAPPAACPADIPSTQGGTGNGLIDIDDLLSVINHWGS